MLLVASTCGHQAAKSQPIESSAPSPVSSSPSSKPSSPSETPTGQPASGAASSSTAQPLPSAAPAADPEATYPGPTRPDWLGSRVLPTRENGAVVVPQTTPAELTDRRFATVDTVRPPANDRFAFTDGPLEGDSLARSTWTEQCPVRVEELRYLTVTFWGFDQRPHTGEMIVNTIVADDIISVFRALYQARFPIEEMRIPTPADVAAPPTGDGNNTAAFVCRAVVGGTRYSEHASGLAIDINPFHNPYKRAEVVLPELAGVYLDRADVRPGMIVEGDAVVDAFDAIGWGWGGRWSSLEDYQHFALHDR